ncbi:flippase-like domain-containing protein [Candidatus Saccharibacteria bacterium]|nr:flippase-like domain-containing protein [Candidatus Saccharibacteria bacterium]
MAKKNRKWFSFRTVLIILTIVLVAYVVYLNWSDILETLDHLQETNVLVLLLLIPEQLLMYYACGQIFFAYLRNKKMQKNFSNKEILRISTELNFVNRAVPAGGVGGLAFLTYRLSPFGVSAGQASFLYVFRYAVTTVINYLQALIAILILLALDLIPSGAEWIIPLALIMNMGVFFVLWFVIFIASSKKRVDFFSRIVEKVLGVFSRIITFGRKKRLIKNKSVNEYFSDIYENVKIARENKRYLKKPALWGIAYSVLEISTYWIVAIALGRPEILPFIMIGEAIGSVFDGIVPYGLYELGMAGVMIALGVDFPTATIVTVMTRVITLLFTIVSGSWPYYKAIRGRNEG